MYWGACPTRILPRNVPRDLQQGVGEALTNWGVMETPGLGYLECKGEQAALLDTLQGLVARHRLEP